MPSAVRSTEESGDSNDCESHHGPRDVSSKGCHQSKEEKIPLNIYLTNQYTELYLTQWCTTFFHHGPPIDFLNHLGAKQVSRPKSDECLSKFMKIMCTVRQMA